MISELGFMQMDLHSLSSSYRCILAILHIHEKLCKIMLNKKKKKRINDQKTATDTLQKHMSLPKKLTVHSKCIRRVSGRKRCAKKGSKSNKRCSCQRIVNNNLISIREIHQTCAAVVLLQLSKSGVSNTLTTHFTFHALRCYLTSGDVQCLILRGGHLANRIQLVRRFQS